MITVIAISFGLIFLCGAGFVVYIGCKAEREERQGDEIAEKLSRYDYRDWNILAEPVMDDDSIVAWRAAQRRVQDRRVRLMGGQTPHSGIGNVTEGPIVDKLASVFRQLEEKDIGRRAGG